MMNNYDDLQQSFGRCLRNNGFIERFYELFLASHPDIPGMFANTDFTTQRLALRRGISAAIAHASGSTLSKRTMEQMVDVHSRKGRAPVHPALYAYWVDSLLTAVREKDSQADEPLLARWRGAMERVTGDFAARY